MGRRGLQEVAQQCAQKTAYAAKRIAELDGFSIPFTAPRFNEFVVRALGPAKELLARLASERNITGACRSCDTSRIGQMIFWFV